MKRTSSLVLLAVGLSLSMSGCVGAGGSGGTFEERLREASIGPVTVMRGDNDEVQAIRGSFQFAEETRFSAETVATAFIEAFGPDLGIEDPVRDVRLDRIENEEVGASGYVSGWVYYNRRHEGVDVFGATLTIRVEDGRVTSVVVQMPADVAVNVDPSIDEAAAEAAATTDGASVVAGETALVIVNEAFLVGGPPGPSRLAWAVRVLIGLSDETRFVDAMDGTVLETRVANSAGILDRAIFAVPGACPDPGTCARWIVDMSTQVIDESGVISGATPTATAMDAYGALASAHGFFSSELGLDSFDGAGGRILTYAGVPGEVARVLSIDGIPRIFVGDGNAVTDIMTHEFMHMVLTNLGISAVLGSNAASVQEAIADLMAAFLGDGDPWSIGEASAAGVLRSLATPAIDHVSDAVASLDPHLNSTIYSHAFYLLANGAPELGIEALDPTAIAAVVMGFARQLLSGVGAFDFSLASLWSMALDLIGDFGPGIFDFRDCGSLLNAMNAVGIGVSDMDGDCFPDNLDTCPDVYNPEQLSTTTLTCRLPLASCRLSTGLCVNEYGEDPAIRRGCEESGGAWFGLLCEDTDADAACLIPSAQLMEVYYEIETSDPIAIPSAIAQCVIRDGIYIPAYVVPSGP